ncbi:MAG TPA: cbb3-type cytochrome c oxidase subunit 3 [Rhodocyclaceae bacterium]
MDINDLRAIFTVITFFMFVGIVWWAYSGRRTKAYEEASRMPLDDDSPVIPESQGPKDADK